VTTGFHIVVVAPDGYAHSHAFDEVALLLLRSFESLRIPCGVGVNEPRADAVNILLGYHLLKDFTPYEASSSQAEGPWEGLCVPYQLEQLSRVHNPVSQEAMAFLKRRRRVWDYSLKNVALLTSLGANADHLPLGYHSQLERIARRATEDIDVLFYGSVNERRAEVLLELKQRCRTETLFGVYGAQRDEAIARSKIILNLHYYPEMILEEARLSFLLNNGRFVISEESDHNPYGDGVVFAPCENLVETCLRYLEAPEERERIARRGYEVFKQRDMSATLQRLAGTLTG